MSIDLDREQPVTLDEAPKLIPAINAALPGTATRKSIHPRTIYNWSSRGKRGVILETKPVGGILVTTKEALQRFFARLDSARLQRFAERAVRNQPRRSASRLRTDKAHHEAMERLARDHGL